MPSPLRSLTRPARRYVSERRLARKAESARQARLRHKQFVTDLQEQAAALRARIKELEVHCTSGPGSATVALGELREALSPEQLQQLQKWCAICASPSQMPLSLLYLCASLRQRP